MKLRYSLIYGALGLGGLGISFEGLDKILSSSSLVTTLHGLTQLTWGLAFAGYAGCYWLFLREHPTTDPKQLPEFELFNNSPWLNAKQQQVLNVLRTSFGIFVALWMLSSLINWLL